MPVTKSMYTRFVEPGRLCRICYGDDTDKMCTIVEIISQKRVVVDGPTTGVARQQIPIRWLQLTDFTTGIKRGARAKALKAQLKADDTRSKWGASAWGKKLAVKAKKAQLSDFERFRVMLAKKAKAKLVNKKIGKK